ncbi:MAG TPA: cupin domain-containing protein [Trueperaceae bacterium]|nr:cupin domain-containing protein [Trueperaceae bacterium]
MKITAIADARRFSLAAVQKTELVGSGDLSVSLLCFEAGQKDEDQTFGSSCLYQVLEGEVLLRHDAGSDRVGPGRLITVPAGTRHHLENAGGGLLVVMATHAR